MRIINESRIDFNYRVSKENPIIAKTIFSNRVSTNIVEDTLVVEKCVDKTSIAIYDMLVYTIEISNITDQTVNNLVLKEYLPQGIKFVNNTFFVNGIISRCVNLNDEIPLGAINAKEKIIITFKGVVYNTFNTKTLVNYCIVSFDYIYNIEEPPQRISIYSNEVITVVKDNLFKQLILNSKIDTSKLKKIEGSLINVKTEVEIVETKVRKWVVNPKMRNVIIIGILKHKVYYEHKGKVCNFTCTDGFSTVLLVPKGVEYFKKVEVKAYNEDTSYTIMDNSNLFISTSLIIKIGE